MRWVLLFLIFALPLCAWQLSEPLDSDYIQFGDNDVILCPAHSTLTPPTFSEPECRRVSAAKINPHRTAIWVQGTITRPDLLLENEQPIGLFLSVKAASRAYIDGQLVGQSGMPGMSRLTEVPGKLDTVFYIPKDYFNKREAKVTLLLSGHHSLFPSSQALLTLGFDAYMKPPHHGRTNYLIALTTFGVFFIGAIYFGAAAMQKYKTQLSLTLSLASVFACFQLLTEVSRGIWAYPYPFHDLRLILICAFSLGVGFALAFHTYDRFKIRNRRAFLIGLWLITVMTLWLIPSFDGKASWAMLVPTIAAGAGAGIGIRKGHQQGFIYAGLFCLFAILILIDPGQFLDKYYYFILMTVLVSLFVQQAFAIQSAIRDHEIAENGRLQLEAALEKTAPSGPNFLLVKCAGKQERIDTTNITALSSAGDYVAIRIIGGRELLHKGSLAALQKTLPEDFLSVHRSHIINTNHIRALKRLPSGVGELLLIDNYPIPVSRRLMPRMRSKLLNGAP